MSQTLWNCILFLAAHKSAQHMNMCLSISATYVRCGKVSQESDRAATVVLRHTHGYNSDMWLQVKDGERKRKQKSLRGRERVMVSKGNANQGEFKREVGLESKKRARTEWRYTGTLQLERKGWKIMFTSSEMQSKHFTSLHVIWIQDQFFFAAWFP